MTQQYSIIYRNLSIIALGIILFEVIIVRFLIGYLQILLSIKVEMISNLFILSIKKKTLLVCIMQMFIAHLYTFKKCFTIVYYLLNFIITRA